MSRALLLPVSITIGHAFAQAPLEAELRRIRELDQMHRAHVGAFASGSAQLDSLSRLMTVQDSLNVLRVTTIIDSLGWPDAEVIGPDGSRTLWLVLQHAALAIQEEYLPEMRLAVEEGKASATDLAYLEDRIDMRRGLPQVYGTQIRIDNGSATLWPLKDETTVDARRAQVGLGPLRDYLLQFGIQWEPKPARPRVMPPPSPR